MNLLAERNLYYLAPGEVVSGPVSLQDLNEMEKHGEITAETLVCTAGKVDWTPLGLWRRQHLPALLAVTGCGFAGMAGMIVATIIITVVGIVAAVLLVALAR